MDKLLLNRRISPYFPFENNYQQVFSSSLEAQGENTVFYGLMTTGGDECCTGGVVCSC